MRITIELEDQIHCFLKLKAEREGSSMGKVISEFVRTEYESSSINQLPLLPSKLLRKALEDFEACERENYVLEPESVIEFNPFDGSDPRVMIGVAGALVIQTLGVHPNRDWSIPTCAEPFIDAVSWLAEGKVRRALEELAIRKSLQERIEDVLHPNYEDDSEGYKDSLRSLAENLSSKGV